MGINIPFWLQHTTFTGREGDEGGEENLEDEGNDGEDDGDEGEGEGSEEESAAEPTEAELKLKKALRQERQLRRAAEREAKQLKNKKVDEENAEAEGKTKEELETERSKTSRLAAKLLSNSIRDVVLDQAKKQNFIDPTDALIDDVIKEIDAHQDEDDPSDIDIDEESVKLAVQALAKKKKHLIGKPNEGEPSGGKFSSKKVTKDGDSDEDTLKENYPSLR